MSSDVVVWSAAADGLLADSARRNAFDWPAVARELRQGGVRGADAAACRARFADLTAGPGTPGTGAATDDLLDEFDDLLSGAPEPAVEERKEPEQAGVRSRPVTSADFEFDAEAALEEAVEAMEAEIGSALQRIRRVERPRMDAAFARAAAALGAPSSAPSPAESAAQRVQDERRPPSPPAAQQEAGSWESDVAAMRASLQALVHSEAPRGLVGRSYRAARDDQDVPSGTNAPEDLGVEGGVEGGGVGSFFPRVDLAGASAADMHMALAAQAAAAVHGGVEGKAEVGLEGSVESGDVLVKRHVWAAAAGSVGAGAAVPSAPSSAASVPSSQGSFSEQVLTFHPSLDALVDLLPEPSAPIDPSTPLGEVLLELERSRLAAPAPTTVSWIGGASRRPPATHSRLGAPSPTSTSTSSSSSSSSSASEAIRASSSAPSSSSSSAPGRATVLRGPAARPARPGALGAATVDVDALLDEFMPDTAPEPVPAAAAAPLARARPGLRARAHDFAADVPASHASDAAPDGDQDDDDSGADLRALRARRKEEARRAAQEL